MVDIQYPYAVDKHRTHHHISQAVRGKKYFCGDCGEQMIAKMGEKNAYHFAHKGKVCQPQPDPDNYLHRVAQDKILAGFRDAQDTSDKYLLGVQCAKCAKVVAVNVAASSARIDKERVVVEGTRSDIVVEDAHGKQTIIEIINTHDLEKGTQSRYVSSGIPIFKRNVSWETIGELDKQVIADEVLNVDEVCADCRQRQSKAEERQRLEREALERRKKVIDAALKKLDRKPSSTPSFSTWFEVSKTGWALSIRPVRMYPKTQRLVFANAIILTELGFKQHNSQKPYLFSFVIRRGKPHIVLYADLGGSDVVHIYEDTAAMLYISALQGQPELEQYAIDSFGSALQEAGVDVRTGFESATYIEQRNVDPTKHVPKAMLDSMIRWGNTCLRCGSASVYKGSCRQCGYHTDGMSDINSNTVELMEDFPGKPVRSPRRRLGSDTDGS